jgi:hypothetical protein
MQPLPFPRTLELAEPIIQTARPADISRLIEFTQKLASVPGLQSERFPAGQSSWQTLIKAQDVVCATATDGRLMGYYAVNQLSLVYSTDELIELRSAHSVACNRFRVESANVSFGAQTAIYPGSQSNDLRVLLLRSLLRTVGLRYRFLFTEVNKNNVEEMAALPREGWRCFHEEDDVCYMILDVAKTLRQLASRLVLRLPNRPEVPLSHAAPA